MNNLKSNVKHKIMLIYLISAILSSITYYFVISGFLNYAPGTLNTNFDKDISNGFYFWQKMCISCIFICLSIATFLLVYLGDIDKYKFYKEEYLKNKSPIIKKKLDKIKKICFNLPNKVLFIFTIVPLVSSLLISAISVNISKDLSLLYFKLILITFILNAIFISITNVYIKKILTQILIDLENTDLGNAKKSSITFNLLLQSIMLVTICIIFAYIVVTSIYEKNFSENLSSYYKNRLDLVVNNKYYDNISDLKNSLNSVSLFSKDDILFITNSDFDFIYQTGDLSDFFKKYAKELSSTNDYKIYNSYTSPCEGILVPVTINDVQYYIGVYYPISLSKIPTYDLTISLLLIIIPCALILYKFFSEIRFNIKNVSNDLDNIAKSTNFNEHKLYVTSLDELGDLSIAYNRIQSQYLKYLNQIKYDQNAIIESERLASLGQLIGGIAHNLKSPIASISGATEKFTDLVKEYDLSINSSGVTSEYHHDIAKDMNECISKIKNYTEYMSDVITTVKNQAVAFSESDNISFELDELVKRINIMMKHELESSLINLNIIMNIDNKTTIHGDINNLLQVIDVMILNSIQAYNNKPNQNIDLTFSKDAENLVISIKDYASGLPKNVQNKLFKEMISTKGKNGTGIGLYMSYSTIRAHFNGNITYSTEENIGTTFNIILPLKQK